MSNLTMQQLKDIIDAAQDVLLMLEDKHPDHGNHDGCNSAKMVDFWDHLNDKAAPPGVVKAMAEELLHYRRQNCTHGFPPGSHTMGKVGCVDCCGEDQWLWDYEPGGRLYDPNSDRHAHSVVIQGHIHQHPVNYGSNTHSFTDVIGYHKHEGGK